MYNVIQCFFVLVAILHLHRWTGRMTKKRIKTETLSVLVQLSFELEEFS